MAGRKKDSLQKADLREMVSWGIPSMITAIRIPVIPETAIPGKLCIPAMAIWKLIFHVTENVADTMVRH